MRMTQVTWPLSGRGGTVLFRRLRPRRLTNRSGTFKLSIGPLTNINSTSHSQRESRLD
jgi:hypothetical protein